MNGSINQLPDRMKALTERLKASFSDKEYRHSYVEESLNTSIATQIKVLREQRKWSTPELAREADMHQSAISRLENVNYGSWSINTLRRLAKAFDVRLKVTFETFGSLVPEIEGFSRESLERAAFDEDPIFSCPEEFVADDIVERDIHQDLRPGNDLLRWEDVLEGFGQRKPQPNPASRKPPSSQGANNAISSYLAG